MYVPAETEHEILVGRIVYQVYLNGHRTVPTHVLYMYLWYSQHREELCSSGVGIALNAR